VVVFDGFGRVAQVVPGFSGPLGIALDANGQIYLSEAASGSVTVFDAQWHPLYKLGGGDHEFLLPNYLALDPAPGSAAVYVSDSKANLIKVYRAGAFDFSFGGKGTNDGQFNFPTGLHLAANGEVFVVDQNNERVQVFGRSGDFRRSFSLVTPLGGMGLGSAGGRSQGITGDPLGRLLVADSFQGFVRVFDAQGNYQGRFGGLGELPGQFGTPLGLVMDGCGRLFTASANNGRVEVLGLDGFAQFSAVPAQQVVCAGTNVAFSVTVTNPGVCTFQWRKGASPLGDGGVVSGATGLVLNLVGVSPADSGQYSVQVTGPGVDLTSPAANLTVLLPPTILSFSSSQTVIFGTNVTFAVGVLGEALSYQWFFRGYPMDGATGSSLTLLNVQPDHAGAYSVEVRNSVGAAVSPVAQLAVLVPPGPPKIESSILLPGVGVQLTINGDMGYSFWIDGANNLADWVALTNIVNETGSLDVVLPLSTNFPNQFYRMRWMP
jgi:DNA-binding beta-propeller fold protein YncE